jgi:hypothetical protein
MTGARTKRRQMSKGQIAMIAAVSCVIVDAARSPKVGNADRGVIRTKKTAGVSEGAMVKAFAVREYADFATQVINGVCTLTCSKSLSCAELYGARSALRQGSRSAGPVHFSKADISAGNFLLAVKR